MSLLILMSGTVSARILFQDDAFSDDPSEGLRLNFDDAGDEDVTLQFGNDGTDGTIVWDDGNSTLNIGDGVHSISINGDVWDVSSAGVGSGFTGFTSTGIVDFSGASRLAIPSGASNPATCTVGDIFFNTVDGELKACTATDTWTTVGPQDFEDVYAYDADKTLTTTVFNLDASGAVVLDSDSTMNIGGSTVGVTADGGALTLSGSTGVNVIGNTSEIDLTTTGAMDLNSGAFTLDASSVAITSTVGNVTLNSASDIIFDDAQLTGVIQLSEVATDWAAVLPSDGIIDNINAFTSNANGEGASLIGIEDVGGDFTSTTVEGALIELSNSVGSATENDVLRYYPEYPDTGYDPGVFKGKLESLVDALEGNFYLWTTQKNTLQKMILKSRFKLPTDFADGKNMTLRYKTTTALVADNSVALELYNVTDAISCGTVAATASTSWATMTLAEATIETGCTLGTKLDAGDIVEFRISLNANNSSSGSAGVGYVDYDYVN